MNANATQLRNHIARILQDPTIRTISFSLQGALVYGPDLAEIGTLVQGGRIGVSVDTTLDSGGEFDFASNAMVFSSHSPDKGTILHESVHGLLHHHKCAQTTLLTHEVAAYLAEMIYFLRTAERSVRQRLQKSFVSGSVGSIYQEALKLIDKHQLLRKSVLLKWDDYQDLRNAIKAHPTYQPWLWQ